MLRSTLFAAAATAALVACGGGQRPAATGGAYGRLARADFNRLAVRANAAVYWRSDADQDGTIDPDEVASLLFYPPPPAWTSAGAFTPAFAALYEQLVVDATAPAPSDPRLVAVLADLDGGRPTLVETDASALPADHQAFLAEMLTVGDLIDALYDTQTGVAALTALGGELDAPSASLLRRNRGPRCATAALQSSPVCSALPGGPKPVVGVYPAALQAEPEFCARLAARPDASALLGDFTAVVDRGGGALAAVPYAEHFAALMAPIADRLEAAATALTDPKEDALRTYLRAAAAAFRSNDWASADEAWARMSALNSRWYVRVGPDETYWEPCVRKAGFHLTLALINPGSLAWQAKIAPIQQDLENGVAALAGAPYVARQVNFHLPDFIDIAANAGDDRGALGATVGQSLPNVGPVAEESRGRTVVMANLYTDPDSRAASRTAHAALLDAPSMALLPDALDGDASLLSTIAHEACHNFGPSADYRPPAEAGATPGPTANEAFGGPLASIMEELKAQTCGLWLVGQLRTRGLIDQALEEATYVDSLLWAMGHVGEGMRDGDGNPSTYPQLAAIQLGFFLGRGGLTFDAGGLTANGEDRGVFHIDMGKLRGDIEALTRLVTGIKGRAFKAGATALVSQFVEGDAVPHALLQERAARAPRANFVYAVR